MTRIIGATESDFASADPDDLSARLYKLIPTQTQDMIAMFMFVILLPLGYMFEIFNVLGYTPFSEAWTIRVGILSYLGLNVYINYYYMCKIGPNGPNPILPNVVQAGFRYCHSCRMNAPPRAYHCPVCDRCAFRRDHHCSFGAVCVGHFNQRYFIAAVANLWIVSAYLVLMTWEWMSVRMGGFTVIQLWQLVVPHVALMLRVISFHQFLCVLVFAFTLTVFVFVSYLMAAQCFCLWRGQTRVEFLLDVHAYQLGFFSNLRQCLGSRWFLVFLSPFIPSPLPSANGTSFETREMVNHRSAKSM